jgi:hypothetical protein
MSNPRDKGAIFYVYEHWRPDRNECFYVGKGHDNRANSVKSRNAHHKAIQAKLHRLGLSIEVRIIKGGLSEKNAFNLECERIAMWRADGADLANLTDGGEGLSGYLMSEEQKKKIAIALKGKKRSEETRKRMSDAFKGRVVADETRIKLSKANKGKPAHFKGKTHSAETRAILSELGKKRGAPNHPPEVIARIAEKHRGMKRSAETCAKISAKAKGRQNPNKGKSSSLRGGTLSEETRAKMSAAKTAYWAKKRQEAA